MQSNPALPGQSHRLRRDIGHLQLQLRAYPGDVHGGVAPQVGQAVVRHLPHLGHQGGVETAVEGEFSSDLYRALVCDIKIRKCII